MSIYDRSFISTPSRNLSRVESNVRLLVDRRARVATCSSPLPEGVHSVEENVG